MNRITTDNGRVGHIAGSIFDGSEGRVITTLCGKSYPEYELHVDDTLDACAACDKKLDSFVNNTDGVVATADEVVAEDTEAPKVTTTTTDTTTSKSK
jgi:hypothetical protein